MSPYLTSHNLQTLRKEQTPIPAGDAPFTDSSHFKSSASRSKPPAKTWDHRLSRESLARKGSTLKGYAVNMSRGKVITLGTARPHAETFPWSAADFFGPDVTKPHEAGAPKLPETQMHVDKYGGVFELGVALSYGSAAGAAQLVRFFTEHTELVHNPPYSDWACSATTGNTSAMDVAFRAFCNPGDHVLCEEYTYSGAVEALLPTGVRMQPVKMDADGLVPEDLDRVLENWDASRGPKPFVLYTIPTGHNPTGITQSASRRRQVYEVAEKHDLYIIEDDPYYLLQLEGGDLISSLPPSYLSLDTSGRVLRLDSTSKIISPGLRCGWMTGAEQVIGKMVAHHEVGVVAPSGISQLMLYKLLDETWGHDGFVRWLEHLNARYRSRRDTLLSACDKYLPASVCRWETPTVGMFVWVDIDWKQHPAARTIEEGKDEDKAILDIEQRIFTRSVDGLVMVNKGSWFRAEKGTVDGVKFRLTFAAAPEVELEEAAMRFGQALRAEFEMPGP